MYKITFECETITPMFLAGADGKTPELRPPSIKGAMRFWWRAINGHLPLNELKKREAAIFGGSGENEGKSKFNIRVQIKRAEITRNKFPNHNVGVISKGRQFSINILEYLAYGMLEYNKELKQQIFIRDYLATNTLFNIIIEYEEAINSLINFQEIMGLVSLVGGLGSRARNGYGRFQIKNNNFDLLKLIKVLKSNPVADYLTFNQKTKLFSLKSSYDSWDKCLAELGKIYKSSREELENRHQFSKRQFISSPIIDNKRQVSLLDRHSKPYFFTIIKNSDNKFDGYIISLYYNYLEGFDNPPEPLHNLKEQFNQVIDEFNTILEKKMQVVI